MNRRRLLGLAACSGALAACSSNVTIRTLGRAYDNILGNSTAYDPAYPESLPYASISVSIKNLSRALLILGRVDGSELHWLSADRSVLVTRHGRLVRTVGFSENLLRTEFSGTDFFENWPHNRQTHTRRLIDIAPANHYGITVESRLAAIGDETIIIGTKARTTTRYEEHGTATLLNWKFTNSYWVDDTGFIWRSTQQPTPSAPQMTIEVTKPYTP